MVRECIMSINIERCSFSVCSRYLQVGVITEEACIGLCGRVGAWSEESGFCLKACVSWYFLQKWLRSPIIIAGLIMVITCFMEATHSSVLEGGAYILYYIL
eukprot:GHVR01061911.1.p1 GENE.GHVR01061911.1~~GHVR01061911.1.p1  ORF type:complete len:101 (+),score=8.34 GHVR01061911.1:606-908(+)